MSSSLSQQDIFRYSLIGSLCGSFVIIGVMAWMSRWQSPRLRTTKPHLFYLNGKLGSGKDTAANFLPLTHRFAHADHLKQIVMLTYDLSHDQVYDAVEKERHLEEWDASPRELLQDVGSYLRSKHPDIFIRKMKKNILQAQKDHPRPVIAVTDCRYDNEAEMGRGLGATVIVIERDPATLPESKHRGHMSEQGISDHLVDHVIHNSGKDLDEFKQAVETLFLQLDGGSGSEIAPRLASSAVSST